MYGTTTRKRGVQTYVFKTYVLVSAKAIFAKFPITRE